MGWSVVSFFPCWVPWAGLLCPFFLAGYHGLVCYVLFSLLGTMGWSVVSFFPCWVRWAGLLCPFFLAGYGGLVCCVPFPRWVRWAGLLCPFSLLGTVCWSVVSFFPCWVQCVVCCVLVSSLRTVGWSVVSDRCCPVAAQGVMVLRWLEQHRRVVVNGAAAAELEGSKALQYMTAIKHGIGVPRSLVTVRPTAEVQRGGWGGVERGREGERGGRESKRERE